MGNQIIPKKSVVPNRVPTGGDLVFGEVSINHADKIIYARHPNGVVQQIAASPQHTHSLADISDLGDLVLEADWNEIINKPESFDIFYGTSAPDSSVYKIWMHKDLGRLFHYYDNTWVEFAQTINYYSGAVVQPEPEPAWTPNDITGIAFWLDATTGIYDSAVGGAAVTSDDAMVRRWEDRSPNARHFVQSTTASCPLLSVNSLSNKNTVFFDGADDYLSGAYNRTYAAQTVFIVARLESKSYHTLFAESQAGVTDQSTYLAANASLTVIGSTVDANAIRRSTSNYTPGQFYIATFSHTGSYVANYLNKIAAPVYADTLPAPYDIVRGRIGARFNANGTPVSGTYLNGFIGEVIAYDKVLSTAESDQIYSYLSSKWGIAL
jgi:hypothetical protein